MPNQDWAKGAAQLTALALHVLGPVKVVHFEVALGIPATGLGQSHTPYVMVQLRMPN